MGRDFDLFGNFQKYLQQKIEPQEYRGHSKKPNKFLRKNLK